MFPVRDFPHPVPSFDLSMVQPTHNPGDTPLVCASWNSDYTPFLLGAMMQLWLESTWQGNDAQVNTALGKMYDFSRRIGAATPCERSGFHSVDYPFGVSDNGWVLTGSDGVYVSSSGWHSTVKTIAGQYYTALGIRKDLSPAVYIKNLGVNDSIIRLTGYGTGLPVRVSVDAEMDADQPHGILAHLTYDADLNPLSSNLNVTMFQTNDTPNVLVSTIALSVLIGPFPFDPSVVSIQYELYDASLDYYDS